jgi:hypothetical protein
MKQTDPNWVAYFFLTDDKPFERLQGILTGFADPRLRYFDVPSPHRPAVSALVAVCSLLPLD